jgi:hypothetical protein
MNLFDTAEAERRKVIGKALAADRRHELLAAARGFAAFIARNGNTVTADEVAALMAENGLDYADLGNAAGSVFNVKFAWTGEVVASRRPSTHGRLIRVWRLA